MLPGTAESYWMDSTPATGYPPLNADLEVDVVVVGGGIAGVCDGVGADAGGAQCRGTGSGPDRLERHRLHDGEGVVAAYAYLRQGPRIARRDDRAAVRTVAATGRRSGGGRRRRAGHRLRPRTAACATPMWSRRIGSTRCAPKSRPHARPGWPPPSSPTPACLSRSRELSGWRTRRSSTRASTCSPSPKTYRSRRADLRAHPRGRAGRGRAVPGDDRGRCDRDRTRRRGRDALPRVRPGAAVRAARAAPGAGGRRGHPG